MDGFLAASPEDADASSPQSQFPAADLASPTVKLAKAGRKSADRSRRAPEAGARAPHSGQPPIQKPGSAQPAAAPAAEPLAAYVLTRSSVSRLADLGGKAIGMAPLGKVAKAHVDAALRLAHLDGDLASVDENKAVRRLLDGDLAGLIIDVDQPPKDLASVPLDRFRMLPIYAPGL
ncbi:hypothetical protein SLNSH_04620 [Alsobacter soli]|uniref:Uncharacterized protein n=1 Tax=Alsobacter soli TaxID=2109933 RepID=A0A2T1HWW3_9HYPH|nr:hypothetical protein [Alsobacter soli]PSC06095.1 hypothetical protein SLNSH_04620 [Alsobacter soli]